MTISITFDSQAVDFEVTAAWPLHRGLWQVLSAVNRLDALHNEVAAASG
jgi:hypothetical protein